MNRVPYRRVMPSRLNSGSGRGTMRRGTSRNENDEPTTGETMILQCIVSGILVVFVLLVSLINIPPANALRDGLRQTLSGAETPRELLYEARHFGEEFLWGPSPETEPESFPEYHPALDIYFDYPYEVFPFDSQPFTEIIPLPPLEPQQYPATADEVPNPQFPVPSGVPELWD